ncbi:prepilin-type N-terminal cleavage/methylation domain-containing protein [Thermodesulfobacteriota bacterium]
MKIDSQRNKALHGFTLIEMVMTIVILGFVSLILIPFFNSITHSPDPIIRERAIALGQGLMDEILSKRWDEVTPSGGGPIRTSESPTGSRGLTAGDPQATTITAVPEEGAGNRNLFDDVDDYNGFSETDTFSDQTGLNPVSLPGYSRSVLVRYIPSNSSPIEATNPAGTTAGGEASATDTKRVVVTVESPTEETFRFVAVVCNF